MSLKEKAPRRKPVHREPNGGPGDEKQQRHSPCMQPTHYVIEGIAGLEVFYMPIPGTEHHAGVEEDQEPEGDHS